MPSDTASRARGGPALDLPPAFRLVTLREVGDAFAHAKAVAAEEGAGTLVYVGRFDLAEFAVVLEPEEPLRTARRALYAGLVALADALAAHAPPEKPITFDWPDAVRVDGGLVGGGRLAWPEGAEEDEPPDWLVFGAMIRTVAMGEGDPGLRPLSAALEDEGFDDLGSGRLVETFARHLMVTIDSWQEKGFAPVARNYLERLGAPSALALHGTALNAGRAAESTGTNVHGTLSGIRRDIDSNGDLLVRRIGKSEVQRHALLGALAVPSWLDPKTGGPRSVKLLKTIRLDPSDTFVFAKAADEGEWAVSGGFLFANADEAALSGKERAAFRSGFLGVASLGWSTLVQVVEASAEDRAALTALLARQFRANLGAPDDSAALSAAEDEIAFAASLSEHPPGTLIAVRRTFEDGAIRESFRTLRPRGERKPMRAFSFLDVDGEEEPAETVDLTALANARPKAR